MLLGLLAFLAILVSASGAPASGAGAPHRPQAALTAQVIAVSDSANLRVLRENGNMLIEEGPARGTLSGTVRSTLALRLSTVRLGFTIYVHGGSITGHGTARLNVGKGEYSSFAGTLAVSRGTGRYAHASGTGRLSGVINRNNNATTVQVEGALHV